MKKLELVVVEDELELQKLAEMRFKSFEFANLYITANPVDAILKKADCYLLDYNLDPPNTGDMVAQSLIEIVPDATRISFASGCPRYREETGLYHHVIPKMTSKDVLYDLLYSIWEYKYKD